MSRHIYSRVVSRQIYLYVNIHIGLHVLTILGVIENVDCVSCVPIVSLSEAAQTNMVNHLKCTKWQYNHNETNYRATMSYIQLGHVVSHGLASCIIPRKLTILQVNWISAISGWKLWDTFRSHDIVYYIMMLMRFSDLSQSDCSNWVMWQTRINMMMTNIK